jgi:predicted dehydrogenase
MPTSIKRRVFLTRTVRAGLGVSAGVTLLADPRSARGAPANDKIVLGIIGVGGRGSHLAQGFAERSDCAIAAIADVNGAILDQRAAEIAAWQGGAAPATHQDFRDLLENKAIDAVVVATPDHWHALATIWACQAGKDVYVEKPPTHNCWEGQQMVAAARQHQRVVQCGFQNRSAPYNAAAKRYIQSGKLGEIHLCRIFNQKPPWGNCPVEPDGIPPAQLNWDMWNGPAPEAAFNESRYRCWNHQWRYSGGDIANDASHQIDLARWLLGVDYPQSVYSTGGRFSVQSAAETPDTQVALYDYEKLLVSFELTLFTPYMLKTDPGVRDNDLFPYWLQNATRIEIYGTEAMMLVGRHGGGWQVFDRPQSRQPVVKDQHFGRFPDADHKENFFECIRSRARPNSDVSEAHKSALMIHYANMSYRLGGKKLAIDPTTEQVRDAEAMRLFRREYRAPWVVPESV